MHTTGTGASRSTSVCVTARSRAVRAIDQDSDLGLELVDRGAQFSMLRRILRAFCPGHLAIFLAAPLGCLVVFPSRVAILLGALLHRLKKFPDLLAILPGALLG